MEYPFVKCPNQSTESMEKKPKPRFNPDNPPGPEDYTPEIIAKLIKQAITLEQESMKLLDLLVELIEQKPQSTAESNNSPFPVNFEARNRIYLD